MVLPMHYDTFFGIQQDPHAFAIRAETLGVRSLVLKPGAWFEL